MPKNMMEVLPKLTMKEIDEIIRLLWNGSEPRPTVSDITCMSRNDVRDLLYKHGRNRLARKVDPWLPLKEFAACFAFLMTITCVTLGLFALFAGGGLSIVYLAAHYHYAFAGLTVPFIIAWVAAGLIGKDFWWK